MGENYKSCDLHRKQFPQNMIDTDEHEVLSLYVEKPSVIEGQKVTLQMFLGKSDDQGASVCIACLNELVLDAIKQTGRTISWKKEYWNEETVARKDGTGTYTKRTKSVRSPDEIAHDIKEKAQQKVAPTVK